MKKSETIQSITKKREETLEKLKKPLSAEEKSRLLTWLAVYNGKLKRLKI
jgi:hypothetical protein